MSAPDITQLRTRILQAMARRTHLGLVDHSPLSYDWRVASARAYRIQQRLQGRRLTRAEWRRELSLA